MEIKGKAIQMLPLVTGQGKNGEWRKQEFIIETGDQYPKKICLSLWGDKISQNPFSMGEEITVFFDAESREYNGRWFTELRAWKVQTGQAAAPARTVNPAPASNPNFEPATFTEESASDDLPF
jgi:hypothetical protein